MMQAATPGWLRRPPTHLFPCHSAQRRPPPSQTHTPQTHSSAPPLPHPKLTHSLWQPASPPSPPAQGVPSAPSGCSTKRCRCGCAPRAPFRRRQTGGSRPRGSALGWGLHGGGGKDAGAAGHRCRHPRRTPTKEGRGKWERAMPQGRQDSIIDTAGESRERRRSGCSPGGRRAVAQAAAPTRAHKRAVQVGGQLALDDLQPLHVHLFVHRLPMALQVGIPATARQRRAVTAGCRNLLLELAATFARF